MDRREHPSQKKTPVLAKLKEHAQTAPDKGCLLYTSYYFKFVRGKKQKDEDLDFFDDEGYEEDPYINEDEEPVIADDEDNGDETKETEETI